MSQYSGHCSSKYLTHKHASFHGCTLEEMGVILAIYASIEIPLIFIFAVLSRHYLGGFIGALLLWFLFFAMLTFFVLLKRTAIYIGRLRNGRAAGYLKLRFKEILHQKFNLKIPYLIRNGKWITRKHVGV